MADEQPPVPPRPEEESKKDTVRINLPPGITGRSAAPPPGAAPPPAPKFKPATPSGTPEDEAKKETAVMGTPVAAPKPKKDTSRVQVSAAKPAVPEAPRPTVKLKRDEAPAAVPPVVTATQPPAVPTAVAAAPSGADIALSIGAIVLSLGVLGYLAFLVYG